MAGKRVAWSEAVAARVVEALAAGMPVRELVRQPWAPSACAFGVWRRRRPGFGLAVRAALAGAQARARAAADAGWDAERAAKEGEVLSRMADEGRSLWSVGRDGDMPARATLDYWVRTRPSFAEAVARATPAGSRHYGAADRPMGRPREFGAAVEAEILARLAEGETLARICRDEGMPSAATARHWRWNRPGFAAAYDKARAAQLEAMADAVVDIADDYGAAAALMEGETDVHRARMRIEARKWVVGARGGAVEAAGSAVEAMDPQVRAARIAELVAKATGERGSG